MEKISILQELNKALIKAADKEQIKPMEAYMKNHFQFYGVRSPIRRQIFREVIKRTGLPDKEDYKKEILEMMQYPKREMNYSAIDLAIKCQKKYSHIDDAYFIRELICTHSWWDSVDGIAPNILTYYLTKFPHQTDKIIKEYTQSDNIWLIRSAILFQLKLHNKTDENLLFLLCKQFGSSKEFFIQKAIGWALREYAKTNKEAVYSFVENTALSPLSVREALKHKK